MNIPDIKSSLPILSVLRYFGIVPDKNGMISCPDPNHQDKHPSCKIYEKSNTFFCFSCGAKGDQIQLIEFLQGQGKHKAILTAKEILGHVPTMKNNKTHHIMDTLSPTQLKETLRLFFEKAAVAFKKSANAQAYCKKRNIDGHKLGLGFSGVTFFRHYTDKQREMAIKAGLLKKHREGSYKSKFTNCIIFPLYNTDGEIIYVYGRSISGSDKFKHVLLGNSYAGIFPSFPTGNIKRIILTEGFGDCATLLTHFDTIPLKDTAVIPLFSAVGGFTEEIRQAISQPQIEEIIQFYDGDKAGGEAITTNTKILEKLNDKAIISAVECPENEDINSLIEGHEPGIFTELITNRKIIIQPGPQQVQKQPVTQGELQLTANGEAKPVKEKNIERGGEPGTVSSTFNTDNPQKLIFTTQTAQYIIKGGVKDKLESLKVTIEIKPPKGKRTKFAKPDFYDDTALEKLARDTAEKFDLPGHQLEEDLFELRGLLEEYREERIKNADNEESSRKYKDTVPPGQQEKCQKFWRQTDLFRALYHCISEIGLVGETRSRMLVFCVASTAGMYHTLHCIIKGNSGKGKTHLMSTICELLPPEIYIAVTTLTDKSLFYGGKYAYMGCALSVEDRVGMTEEIKLYFREFQTKGWIGRQVSMPDANGKFFTRDQKILGPITTLSCTTDEEIYPDDENRCFIVSIDESEEQLQRILEYRGRVSAGLVDKATIREKTEFIRNCLRMLKPYEVVNRYAPRLRLPPYVHDKIRLYDLFLKLVDQVTLLHQFQCEKDDRERLITTTKHVRLAVETMFDAIVVKADDISDKVRKTFEAMKKLIRQNGGEKYQEYRFKVREIRLGLNIGKSTLANHINYLKEAEYIVKVAGNDDTGNIYKIAYWDDYEGLRERIKRFMIHQIEGIEDEEKEGVQ